MAIPVVQVRYEGNLNKDGGNQDGEEMDSHLIGKISRTGTWMLWDR